MGKLNGLSIIENEYCYNEWRFDTSLKDRNKILSTIRYFKDPRDITLYRNMGSYGKAGVEYEIFKTDFNRKEECEPYAGVLKNLSDRVCEEVKKGRGIVMSSGYCAHAPAIAGGIMRAVSTNKKIGVIWIDAHADNRIAETTESTDIRLVGIPVSTMSGQTSEAYRTDICGLKQAIEGRNILVSDGRMNIPEFNDNLEKAGSRKVSSDDFKNPQKWEYEVQRLADQVDMLYLSVDVDILASEWIPAYAKKVLGGHTLDTVKKNVEMVMKTGKVIAFSLFCVDFDRYDMGGEKTYNTGREILETGLKAWKDIPDIS